MSKLPKTEIFELLFFILALVFFVMSVSFNSLTFGILMAVHASIGFGFALVNEKKNPRDL